MTRGDGSGFFAAATNKSMTCYGVINGKLTTYQAKPDVNGVLTCSKAQQTAGGSGAGALHVSPCIMTSRLPRASEAAEPVLGWSAARQAHMLCIQCDGPLP